MKGAGSREEWDMRPLNVLLYDYGVIVQDALRADRPSLLIGPSGTPQLAQFGQELLPQPVAAHSAYAVLGVLRLTTGCAYVVVASEAELVGDALAQTGRAPIYRRKAEKALVASLAELAEEAGFHYSEWYDLSRPAQAQPHRADSAASFCDQPQRPRWDWKTCDPRFVWNTAIAQPFLDKGLGEWITPVVDAFVSMERFRVGDRKAQITFISRRECMRSGMRFHTRGTDGRGYVANFAETEQIVVYNGIVTSYVQIRGSIPLMWEQRTSGLGLATKIIFSRSTSNSVAVRRHFDKLFECYDRPVICVNLVDQSGKEAELGDAYELYTRNLRNPDIKYFAFDFHRICKGNRFENIGFLKDMIEKDVASLGFYLEFGGQVAERQQGVVRTNCVDCLDRTNVAQSLVSRLMLNAQLRRLGIIQATEDLGSILNLETFFNDTWADNADFLSSRYTGTGAMKTDFTRTGKRSVKGNIKDGVNAIRRIVNHQLSGTSKQEAIDVFLCNVHVDRSVHVTRAGDGVEQEGSTFLFSGVQKVERWSKDLRDVLLRVTSEPGRAVLTEYEPAQFFRRDVALASVTAVECHPSDHRVVQVFSERDPFPARYVFTSPLKRQHFVNVLLLLRAQELQLAGREEVVPAHVSLRTFLGSWDLIGRSWPLEEMCKWIPEGHDLYVLGALNCEYATPAQFSMSCTTHFVFEALSLLGPDYELIEMSARNKTVTMPVEMVANGERLLPSLAAAQDKSDEQNTKAEGDLIGAALSFQLFDTALCFLGINCETEESWSGKFVHLKNDIDLDNDYHHIFILGKPYTWATDAFALRKPAHWNEIVPSTSTGDAVLYKARTGCALGNLCLWPAVCPPTPSGRPAPLGLSVTLEMANHPNAFKTTGQPKPRFVVTLSSLSATMKSVDSQKQVDVQLRVGSRITANTGKSAISRRAPTTNFIGSIELVVFAEDYEHAASESLRVELLEMGGGSVIMSRDILVGCGLLPLREPFDALQNPPPPVPQRPRNSVLVTSGSDLIQLDASPALSPQPAAALSPSPVGFGNGSGTGTSGGGGGGRMRTSALLGSPLGSSLSASATALAAPKRSFPAKPLPVAPQHKEATAARSFTETLLDLLGTPVEPQAQAQLLQHTSAPLPPPGSVAPSPRPLASRTPLPPTAVPFTVELFGSGRCVAWLQGYAHVTESARPEHAAVALDAVIIDNYSPSRDLLA
eukprot:m51a1_g6062 hypothetical protein (1206) ;mRNA; f:250052-256026